MALFVAMPILKTFEQPNIDRLQSSLKSLSGICTRRDVRQEDGVISFGLDDVDVSATLVERPIPWTDLEGPCQTSLLWKDATPKVRSHTAHVIACSYDVEDQKEPKALAWYLTKGIEALLPTMDALGVYWGAGTLVIPSEVFIAMSEASSLENLPLYLWIDFRCYPESKSAYTLFTTGLKSLGFMEIEIFKSRCAPSELVDAAFNVAHYLLDKGPILKDGDTIGTRVDECIRITHVKSFLERSETVYRLEM